MVKVRDSENTFKNVFDQTSIRESVLDLNRTAFCIGVISRHFRKLLGAVHKRRPQSGRRGVCTVRTFFGQGERGFLQMWTSALFGAKSIRFFRILWCVCTDKGVEPVRTVCGQGGGVIFLRFCADVFYGRPLIFTKEDDSYGRITS